VTFDSSSTLQQIHGHSFFQTAIRSIQIPASVEVISERCFASCNLLTTVKFEPNSNLACAGPWAFSGSGLTHFHIPASVESLKSFIAV
jgi:hypothetical protein